MNRDTPWLARYTLIGCLSVLGTLCAMVYAEMQLPDIENRQTAGADGTGVYLDDSLEGSDALIQARTLVEGERWREAAELMQATLDRHGDKLYRISPGYYVGLREHINGLIADWPAAGLEAYRSLYERELEKALEQSGSGIGPAGGTATRPHAAKKLELLLRFFCTRGAIPLADTIAQEAIESGDFSLAEAVWTQALTKHPDSQERATHLRAMLAIVNALQEATANDREVKAETVGRMRIMPEFDAEQDVDLIETKVRWKGQDRPLGDILSEISNFSPPPHSNDVDEWWTYGGSFTRNRTSGCAVDELGVQWRFSFRNEDREDEYNEDFVTTESDRQRARDVSVYPVVAGELVFIQRYREIVALRQTTGELVWRFRADSVEREPPSFIQEQPPGWDAPTVVEGKVFASISGPTSSFHGYGSSQSPHELVCLDARTGALLWRVSERAFGARFAEVRFDPSPIIEHDRLYIVGRRRRSFGFEDAYLFRFDARTGRLIGQTHVGSASTGTYGAHAATKSVAAKHGDTVYVASNLGSVAAVSAYTGAIRWLRLYERSPDGLGRASVRSSEIAPWHFNPIILANEGLVVQPMDSRDILILSYADGQQTHAIPIDQLAGQQPAGDQPTHNLPSSISILGVRSGRLCAAGDEITCFDLEAQQSLWAESLPEGADLFGRAAWADDRILVPTTKGLSVYRVEDGNRTDLSWPPAGAPGNLLALSNQLIIAGPEVVTSYVRKSEMWNRLRERLAAAPHDPVPALELAAVAMRSGETMEAIDALELAVSRSDEGAKAIEDSVRSRIFRSAVSFAEKIADLPASDERAVLGRLYDVAARFPTDQEDHLLYRLKFASLFGRAEHPDRALTLYQQVLQDRSLRELTVPVQGTTAAAAGGYCRDRIAELIESHGPELYEPYEREAERLLTAGNAAGDEATITRVVQAYPNSKAAPRALITLGELLGRSGRTQEAVRWLIQAYHRYPDAGMSGQRTTVNRAELIKRIADAFEWGGRREDAYRWLTRGALEYPGVLVEDGEKKLTFRQLRERLDDVRDHVEPTRPEIKLPLDMRYTREFDGPVSLLVPRFVDDPFGRWSRVYVYSDRRIRAIDPATGEDMWDKPVWTRESVDLLTARENVAVFATSYELFGVDPATGERRWSDGAYPRAFDDPQADWEHGKILRTHTLHGHALVSVRDDGTISAINVRSGERLWSVAHDPPPAGAVALGEDWLVYHAMEDGQVVLYLVHPATGEWIDTVVTDETRPVDHLLLTLDGQVLIFTSQSIAAIDPRAGSARWRVSTLGHFRRESILLDVDAVYFSPDGRDLRKISLDDGRVIWQIVGLIGRGEDELTVDRHDAQLIVSTSRSVVAVDAVTGMNLWRGTTPRDPHFRARALTRDHAVAVHLAEGDAGVEWEGQAFFYDLRNASGLISTDGAPELGDMEELRRILFADDAILIQSGPTTIQGVTGKASLGASQ